MLMFTSFTKLQRHLNFGRHQLKEKNETQLAMVCNRWAKRFEGNVEQISVNNIKKVNGQHATSILLKMGWAIPEQTQR